VGNIDPPLSAFAYYVHQEDRQWGAESFEHFVAMVPENSEKYLKSRRLQYADAVTGLHLVMPEGQLRSLRAQRNPRDQLRGFFRNCCEALVIGLRGT
jgi:hypothetical protein